MATKKPRLRVGDVSILMIGGRPEKVVIREDRGPLGVGGRRLYRIEVPVVPGETLSYEVPEDDLMPVEEAVQQ